MATEMLPPSHSHSPQQRSISVAESSAPDFTIKRKMKVCSSVKKNVMGIALLAAAFAAAPVALADSFNYTYTQGGVTATGILTGNSVSSGVYDITSGTINLTDLSNANIDGSGILVPIPSNGNFYTGGGTILSFLPPWNSNLYPNQNPEIDYYGAFTFDLTSGAGNGSGVYIGAIGANDYQIFAGNWDIANLDGGGTFSTTPVSPTPEPSSLLLLGTGLLGAAGIARRKIAAKFA